MSIRNRLQRVAQSRLVQVFLFCVALGGTVVALAAPHPAAQSPQGSTILPAVGRAGEVAVSATMSQSTFVQNSNGSLYMTVSITPPTRPEAHAQRNPTDLVVVLDKSGSMSPADRLPFAKAAIRDLVGQLREDDRFALIAFDTTISTIQQLVYVNTGNRTSLEAAIESIQASGSTNISDALRRVESMVAEPVSGRVRKIVLLSDGEANVGETSMPALTGIARSISGRDSVLSAIGIGLGFNETIMSSLADHGMGNYAYLERLNQLDQILAKELQDARIIVANGSELAVRPADGVTLVDASGYPIERAADGSMRIATGNLRSGIVKTLTLTFAVPTSRVNEASLGTLAFSTRIDGEDLRTELPQLNLQYAVVEPARRDEALASIDEDIYRNSWVKNNFGRLQHAVGKALRNGDRSEAAKAITEYRDELRQAEAASSVSLTSAELDSELSEMSAKVSDAFAGAPAAQLEKQNRYAKEAQAAGMAEQRIEAPQQK